MTWVAVAIGGAAIVGAGASVISADKSAGAAKTAAATQAAADTYAADLQHTQYEETRSDYAPWRTAGGSAVTQQADLLGLNGADSRTNAFSQFREDPGYQYSVDQAVQGVDRSAAARGLLTSGATIKAIQDRAYNLADQGYSNYFNRLGVVAGTGQTATAGTAAAGQSAATNAGNAAIAGGNAIASGYTNAATAMNNGVGGAISSLNNGVNNYLSYGRGSGGGSSLTPPSYTVPSYDTPTWAYPTGGV